MKSPDLFLRRPAILDQLGQFDYILAMSRQVNIAEAKAKLSELVEAASRGEEIVLARHGRPVARISGIKGSGVKRRLGALRERLSPAEIAALTRAVERPPGKAEKSAVEGGASDRIGLALKTKREKRPRR